VLIKKLLVLLLNFSDNCIVSFIAIVSFSFSDLFLVHALSTLITFVIMENSPLK